MIRCHARKRARRLSRNHRLFLVLCLASQIPQSCAIDDDVQHFSATSELLGEKTVLHSWHIR
jgi:hypothetical protein